MFVLYAGKMLIGQITFGISLILMMISLALSVREIHVSVEALDVQITDIEAKLRERSARAPGIGGRLGLQQRRLLGHMPLHHRFDAAIEIRIVRLPCQIKLVVVGLDESRNGCGDEDRSEERRVGKE